MNCDSKQNNCHCWGSKWTHKRKRINWKKWLGRAVVSRDLSQNVVWKRVREKEEAEQSKNYSQGRVLRTSILRVKPSSGKELKCLSFWHCKHLFVPTDKRFRYFPNCRDKHKSIPKSGGHKRAANVISPLAEVNLPKQAKGEDFVLLLMRCLVSILSLFCFSIVMDK